MHFQAVKLQITLQLVMSSVKPRKVMTGLTVTNVPISYIHQRNEVISILNVEYSRTFVSNEWIQFDTECPQSTNCPFQAKIKEKKLYLFASQKVDLGVIQLIRITAKEYLTYSFLQLIFSQRHRPL